MRVIQYNSPRKFTVISMGLFSLSDKHGLNLKITASSCCLLSSAHSSQCGQNEGTTNSCGPVCSTAPREVADASLLKQKQTAAHVCFSVYGSREKKKKRIAPRKAAISILVCANTLDKGTSFEDLHT